MEAWLQLGSSERACIMAAGRRKHARSRCGFSCQTIELGFWTPTGLVVASDFSEWDESVLPLKGQAGCRGAIAGSGRRDAARADRATARTVVGSQ
jgi:hypothetical protein